MDNNLPDIRPNQVKWQPDQTAYWLNRLKNTLYRNVNTLNKETSSDKVDLQNILNRLASLEAALSLLEQKIEQCCGESGLVFDWFDELYPIGIVIQMAAGKNPNSLIGGAWQDITPAGISDSKSWERVG